MTQAAFTLVDPSPLRSAAVFSSPHSGREYPESLLAASRLDRMGLRASEDAFVDELFAVVPLHGAPLLAATAPRTYVDLNRAPNELDPALIEGVRDARANPRIAAGLGVVPRVVAEGRPIYEGKISLAEAQGRIAARHAPFHARLGELLDRAKAQFGVALLFDLHSMPSDALRGMTRARGARPEVVLGDRFGASASGWVVDAVEAAFEAEGFRVARNAPFAGGYVTQTHGRPVRDRHAVQIEIDRALYMDEARIARGPGFDDVRARLGRVAAALAAVAPDRSEGLLAAE